MLAEHVEELNCRIEALEEQRNKALTEAVIARARLSIANAKLAKLQNDVAELSAKLTALSPSQEA